MFGNGSWIIGQILVQFCRIEWNYRETQESQIELGESDSLYGRKSSDSGGLNMSKTADLEASRGIHESQIETDEPNNGLLFCPLAFDRSGWSCESLLYKPSLLSSREKRNQTLDLSYLSLIYTFSKQKKENSHEFRLIAITQLCFCFFRIDPQSAKMISYLSTIAMRA